eukprot:11592788-Prorocentrum_lima.AAC.1
MEGLLQLAVGTEATYDDVLERVETLGLEEPDELAHMMSTVTHKFCQPIEFVEHPYIRASDVA